MPYAKCLHQSCKRGASGGSGQVPSKPSLANQIPVIQSLIASALSFFTSVYSAYNNISRVVILVGCRLVVISMKQRDERDLGEWLWSSLQRGDGALGRGADHAVPVAGVPVRVSPVGEHRPRILDDRAFECHERRRWQQSRETGIRRKKKLKFWQERYLNTRIA
jgi:hypothetical protein